MRLARRSLAILALLAPVRSAAAQSTARDTLVYSVAIAPTDPHLTIEARLTASAPGVVVLVAPPASGPAGTTVTGLAASDDRGGALVVTRASRTWTVVVPVAGAVRFRYRLDINRRTADGSTGSGLDSTHFYAVTRSLFVAPDPTALRKSGRPYPVVGVQVLPPDGWRVLAGWSGRDNAFTPRDGDDLLGATLAAAPDFRVYEGRVANTDWQLAIRGRRYFADSSLAAAIRASLSRGAAALGPVPVAKVAFTSDLGRKGRTSGSLQGLSSVGLIWEPSEVLETARLHDLFHETLHLWFGGEMETERWWIEGVTDYMAARLYSGWQERPEELAFLCYQSLRNYQAIEHNTSLTMTQENRRHMGGDNTELLVYRKGMLAGLLLDAAIRNGSGGRKTLDDVSRRLLQTAAHRQSRLLRETEVRDVAVQEGGPGVQAVWTRVVDGTELLTEDDVANALAVVTGRRFAPPPLAKAHKELSR